MKSLRLTLLASILILPAAAADIAGTWKAVFTCPLEQRPKMVSEIILHLAVDGDTLTGTVHAGNWPGVAPIADGRIEGDRISFTMTGSSAWMSRGPQGEASGYPKLSFTGTIEGGEMKLQLVWTSVMIYGPPSRGAEYPMRAKRITE